MPICVWYDAIQIPTFEIRVVYNTTNIEGKLKILKQNTILLRFNTAKNCDWQNDWRLSTDISIFGK